MINIPGQLAIRTIHGRNGAFNVARLLTSIGEFAVKDPILEQYTEGKYEGSFVIAHIGPSKPYLTGSGRIVIEAPKAKIDSMVLNNMDALSQDDTEQLDQKVVDPLEEEVPAVPASPPTDAGDAPFGMPSSEPAPRASPAPTNEDEVLFGTLWPLGDIVKLDSTVDRQRMRAQCVRLGQLGYKLDFKQQIWERDS